MILTPNDSAFIGGSYHLNSGSAIYGGLIHPDIQQPQQYQQQPQHYQSSASSATPPSDYWPYSVDYEGSSSTDELHDTGSGVGVNGGYNPVKPARPHFPNQAPWTTTRELVVLCRTYRFMALSLRSHLSARSSVTSLNSKQIT